MKREYSLDQKLRHIGLDLRDDASDAEIDRVKGDMVRRWILACDQRLLITANGEMARYGRWPRALAGDMLCQRIRLDDALQYYSKYADELPQDILLCRYICPVFLLHGFVALLRDDCDRYYASYDTLLMLHVLKQRLIMVQADVAAFLKRLFQLIEKSVGSAMHALCDTDQPYNGFMYRYDHYMAIVTVFLTSNVNFMCLELLQRQHSTEIGYHMCVDDVKRRGAIQTLIEQNLLPLRVSSTGSGASLGGSEWNQTYLLLQMDSHARAIESQWMRYYSLEDQATPQPRALVLDVPPYDMTDGNQLIAAVVNNPATVSYATAVINIIYGHCGDDACRALNIMAALSKPTIQINKVY